MRFELGKLVATRGVLAFCQEHEVDPMNYVSRHVHGDWGDMEQEDKDSNEAALTNGSRIFSSYIVGTEKIYVITEWDRSATTVLLPDEY